MINKDQLLEALEPLMEPQFNKSVVELNLVRDVMFKEDTVSLSLIVTTEDEAIKEKAKAYIQQTLEKLGIAQVHIRFRLMTDYERNQIKDTAQPAAEKQTQPVQPPIEQPILGRSLYS